MCGGPFEHKHSRNYMIAELLKRLDPAQTTQKKRNATQLPVINMMSDQPVKVHSTQRPIVNVTADHTGMSSTRSDVVCDHGPNARQGPGVKSTSIDNDDHCTLPAQITGPGKLQPARGPVDEVGEAFMLR
jgi:hypothetical protein